MTKKTKPLDFIIGDIVYLTHGVGELNIEAVKVLKINRGMATVEKDCGGEEVEVAAGSLASSAELMKEVYNYMQHHTYHNFKNREKFLGKKK